MAANPRSTLMCPLLFRMQEAMAGAAVAAMLAQGYPAAAITQDNSGIDLALMGCVLQAAHMPGSLSINL